MKTCKLLGIYVLTHISISQIEVAHITFSTKQFIGKIILHQIIKKKLTVTPLIIAAVRDFLS